jgi:hypothetical protein
MAKSFPTRRESRLVRKQGAPKKSFADDPDRMTKDRNTAMARDLRSK